MYQSFEWDRLDRGADAGERKRLCEALTSDGFALVSLSPASAEIVASMRASAMEFFLKPREERCTLGRLRLYTDKVIGYRELGGGVARFLEVHALAGMGSIPKPRGVPNFSQRAAVLHEEFQRVGRVVVGWLAENIGVPPAALLQCLDEASLSNLEVGDCGASVLRLACYGLESDAVETEGSCGMDGIDTTASCCAANSTENVSEAESQKLPLGAAAIPTADGGLLAFDEHTDASFLTLAPVCLSPGLQMRGRRESESGVSCWLDVESGNYGSGENLVVFVGDFIEVLTKGRYRAARHRVLLPANVSSGGAAKFSPRVSMPFLMRGQPGAVMNTMPFLENLGEDASLLRVESISIREMRQFLDLKGRTLLSKDDAQ